MVHVWCDALWAAGQGRQHMFCEHFPVPMKRDCGPVMNCRKFCMIGIEDT